MVLRHENQGELTAHGCFLFFFAMFCILILGVLSVLQAAQSTEPSQAVGASQFVAPKQNYLGFLWLVMTLGLLIAVPVYVALTYRSALVFRFSKGQDAFFRGRQRVCRLRRIENLSIREEPDPDGRYLYTLELFYDDGQQMLLFNGYEERVTLNLANELSAFVHVPVIWRQTRRRLSLL